MLAMKGERGNQGCERVFPGPVRTVYDRRGLGFQPPQLELSYAKLPMSKTLASYWRFLLAGLINQHQTGAVVPSQRFLISKMIAPVPPTYEGQILELGAGTGALTFRLAARCPRARILACEINPVLARDLESRVATSGLDSKVQAISTSAEHLMAFLRRRGGRRPDFIISGIPLAHLDRDAVFALVDSVHETLATRGMYIQFQHSTIDRKKIKMTFSKLWTVPILLNFPPAVIYYALK